MKKSKKAGKARASATRAKAQGELQSAQANTRSHRERGTKVIGVTVPKTLTNALDTLINSAQGREILATALVAGATAAAAALTKNADSSEVAKNRKTAADAGKQLTQSLSEAAAGAVAGIITEAARSLLPKSLTREIQNEESRS
jgi:hypothetical protein